MTRKIETAPRFHGLASTEVEESRTRHGANLLTPPARNPWWKEYLAKFDDPVIRILLIAAVIATAVGLVDGRTLEGIGIMIAVLLATTLAFLNEFRANREFDILNRINEEVAVKVIRDGRFATIPRKDLVVGDVALVELGEETPADARVLDTVSFLVDESRLTGESAAVSKRPKAAAGTGAAPADPASHEATYPRDVVLRGTMVVDGHATIEITAVGDHTEIGKTARAAAEETGEETPLSVQLERLSKLIGVVGFAVAVAIFAALLSRSYLSGELAMERSQWTITGVLLAAAAVGLVRVWLPVVYDGLELAGRARARPAWLERQTIAAWAKSLAAGAALFAAGAISLRAAGLVPTDPRGWIPPEAARELLQFFMIAVTIIVVAVPEGLAMSVTLSLAYSMRKMTATNSLVRRMSACETIGAATVICSDKTGTLTQNEMRVQEIDFPFLCARVGDHTGIARLLPDPPPALLVEAVAANSTANLSRPPDGGPPAVLGNPTECALLLWLDENGIDYLAARDGFAIARQYTFTTERKYMATLGSSSRAANSTILHVKGAPEILLARSLRIRTEGGGESALDDRTRHEIDEALAARARRGMRTLGFAYRTGPDSLEPVDDPDLLVTDLVWLGAAALMDPVRPEVPPAIESCRRAGIEVKIVTGDNPETAKEIARQIGLVDADKDPKSHLTGKEFGDLDDAAARDAAREVKVLSRARPMHKVRLVRSLQELGHVVAVTGDGTNDAPALNYANVGLSMGRTGTAVAKEASDIVLLDDSFRTIANAVLWGRSLYLNIQKFLLFQLTINVSALAIAFLGPFLGVEIPLTVIQMLWVNLIMDTFAALALATEPPDPAVMKRPPRRPDEFILTPPMRREILVSAVLFVAVLASMLLAIQADGHTSVHELSVFYTVFVLLQFWNLFNARVFGSDHSAFRGVRANPSFLVIAGAILAGQILIIQVGGEVFRTQPLTLVEWAAVIGGTSLVLLFGELRRAAGNRSRGREPSARAPG